MNTASSAASPVNPVVPSRGEQIKRQIFQMGARTACIYLTASCTIYVYTHACLYPFHSQQAVQWKPAFFPSLLRNQLGDEVREKLRIRKLEVIRVFFRARLPYEILRDIVDDGKSRRKSLSMEAKYTIAFAKRAYTEWMRLTVISGNIRNCSKARAFPLEISILMLGACI